VSAEFFPESADLTADLTAVYCRTDATSLCLIEQVRFRVAVTVGAGTDTQVLLPYTIQIPDAVDG
jgi:hypothetical protein